MAGEFTGANPFYLEAGSGVNLHVSPAIVPAEKVLSIPLIVVWH
jgi:heptaprenylglyceryl phosphate synthase